jgi:hypothetical protein
VFLLLIILLQHHYKWGNRWPDLASSAMQKIIWESSINYIYCTRGSPNQWPLSLDQITLCRRKEREERYDGANLFPSDYFSYLTNKTNGRMKVVLIGLLWKKLKLQVFLCGLYTGSFYIKTLINILLHNY